MRTKICNKKKEKKKEKTLSSAVLLRLVYTCFDIVLMALFCAVIRRDLVSLLRFLFLIHIQVSRREISLICCL